MVGEKLISETSDNERAVIVSPYLDSDQAAAYLGLTRKALYARVERGELRPLRWKRGRRVKYKFTREGLDAYMHG